MHRGFNGNVQIASLQVLCYAGLSDWPCYSKAFMYSILRRFWRRCCRRLSMLQALRRHQTTTDDDFCAINNLGSPLPAVDGRKHGSHDFGLLQQTGLSGVSCSFH